MTKPPLRRTRRAAVVRLLAVLGVVAVGATLMTTASSAKGDVSLAAVPRADCGPGSCPETSIQGRVPAGDYRTGRAEKGYTCNTRQVSHFGGSGGLKVLRYVDRTGRSALTTTRPSSPPATCRSTWATRAPEWSSST